MALLYSGGPEYYFIINFYSMSALMDRALARAQGFVEPNIPKGDPRRQENPPGSNWGHPVQDFLSSVDTHIPASWCMAFMYWLVKDAAAQLGLENPMMKTGGCLVQWHNRLKNQIALVNGHLPDLESIQPGDIMIMDHGHGLGHTGIVESVNADGSINTIEGNTNDTGSREGVEVDRKVRHVAAPIIGFLRF